MSLPPELMVASHGELQSTFARLVDYCRREVLQISDLPRITIGASSDIPLFHLHITQARKLLFQVDSDWRRGLGGDIVAGVSNKAVMAADLRYCPYCLADGLHAAVFQHLGAAVCPFHEERLRRGCPYCGQAIGISCRHILLNHQFCQNCGHAVGKFDSLKVENPVWRDRVLQLSGAIQSDSFRRLWTFKYRGQDAQQTLADRSSEIGAVLHLTWPMQRLPYVRYFSEATHSRSEYLDLHGQSEMDSAAWEASVNALLHIAAFLKRNDCYLDYPWTPTIHSRCMGLRSPLASAAFWRTVDTFHAKKFLMLQRSIVLADCYPFSGLLPQQLWAIRIVAEQLVANLYAFNLLKLRKQTSLSRLPQAYFPSPVAFSPAWRSKTIDGVTELTVRSRISVERIERLVRRYRHLEIHIKPE